MRELEDYPVRYDPMHPLSSNKAKALTGLFALLSIFIIVGTSTYSVMTSPLPDGFVYLHIVDPNIVQDIRYCGSKNFVGKRLYAYFHPRCILTNEAATALSEANKELIKTGFVLKVYDCYRPQRTMDFFTRWKETNDTAKQEEYYPNLSKDDLYIEGYLANQSSHSRGSTVAVTIVSPSHSAAPQQTNGTKAACFSSKREMDESIDMGSNFDCFNALSLVNATISEEQKINRQKLIDIMSKHKFQNDQVWWRFTLTPEPFPSTYFDFVVQ